MGTKSGKQNSGLSTHPPLGTVWIIVLDNLVAPTEGDPARTQTQKYQGP